MQQVVLNPSSARTSKTESLQTPDEMQNYVPQPSVSKISCAATTPTATIEPNHIRFPSPTPPFRPHPSPLPPYSHPSFRRTRYRPLSLSPLSSPLTAVPLRNAISSSHNHPPPDFSDLVATPSYAFHLSACDYCLRDYWGARPKQVGITWPFELPPLSGGERGLTWLS